MQTTTIEYNGKTFDFDAAVNLMDDEIREELSSAQDWESDQQFFDAYVSAHAQKFSSDFIIN